MDDTKRKTIEDLAADHERKRARWTALGYRNVAGLTPEEREQSAKEYAVAEAEMLEANARLRGAVAP